MISINVSNIDFDGNGGGGGGKPAVLEEKTIVITSNGTSEVLPNEGYDGLSKVTINTSITGDTSALDFSIIGYDVALSNEINAQFNAPIEYAKTLYDAWNPSKTNAISLYYNKKELIYAPNIDTSNVTNMQNMFNGCSGLTTVPLFNTSNVTSMENMFKGCTSLTTVPQFNTSNVTNMQNMFNGCSGLTTVPLFNTSNVTNMLSMFSGCTSLTTVPQFNTSNVTIMQSMFKGCTSLISIPLLECGKVTNISSFLGSSNITTLTTLGGFKDLKINWNDNYGLYRCPNLTYESVMNVINNLYDFRGNGDETTTRTLKLNASTFVLLNDDDKAIATAKGWILSK